MHMQNWKSKYIEKNVKESHVYLFTNLEIKRYIQKFLGDHGLALDSYQINFLDSTIDLFVSYYQTSNSLDFIQKKNFEQKIRIRRKKFSEKLTQISGENRTSRNTLGLTDQMKNYYILNRSYSRKKFFIMLKIFKIVKTTFQFLRFSNKKKPVFLISYYKNCLRHLKYFFFLLRQRKKQKRLKTLKYYKIHTITQKYETLKNCRSNNFIKKLLEGLVLFTDNQFNISLTVKQVNRNIKFSKKQTQNFKRMLSKLRKFRRNDFFDEGVNTLFNAIKQQYSAKLIASYIAKQLGVVKRHKFFLTFVAKTLSLLLAQKFAKPCGIKLQVRGRINNSSRSKLQAFNIGKISLVTTNQNLTHSQQTAYGPNGTLGVKVWVVSE